MATLKVRVLVGNVYNGENHRALPKARKGEIIEVAAPEYAESLIADGLVEPYFGEPEPAETDDGAPDIVADTQPLLGRIKRRGRPGKPSVDE